MANYFLALSTFDHAFQRISMSGTISNKLMSSIWPSLAAKSP